MPPSELPDSHLQRLRTALGAGLGILGVMLISGQVLGAEGSALVVASMGASAVLLFTLPQSPLSRPWPVLGGHVLAALIGVACAQGMSEPWLAAALAVGLVLVVIHYLDCFHPPGGATALAAVMGGAPIRELGFGFVLEPVLLNALVLTAVVSLFHALLPLRRLVRQSGEAGDE